MTKTTVRRSESLAEDFSLSLPPNLSCREKILLTLLTVGALAEDLLISFAIPRKYWANPGYLFTGNPDYEKEPKPLQDALSRLLKKKWITAEGAKGNRHFRLAAEGLTHLFSKFPRLKHRDYHWDGVWRLIVYDIREAEKKLRARLRRELRYLGFAFVQKSVWLSPFPVEKELEQFLRTEGLWGKILLFKATLPPAENRRLVNFFTAASPLSSLLNLDLSGKI